MYGRRYITYYDPEPFVDIGLGHGLIRKRNTPTTPGTAMPTYSSLIPPHQSNDAEESAGFRQHLFEETAILLVLS